MANNFSFVSFAYGFLKYFVDVITIWILASLWWLYFVTYSQVVLCGLVEIIIQKAQGSKSWN